MSTPRITLGELEIEGVIGADPFGALFRGRERSSGDAIVMLGVTPPSGQKLSVVKLQQAMRGVHNISRPHIAPVVDFGLIDEEMSATLSALSSDLDLSGQIKAYIAYHIQDTQPLADLLPSLDVTQRVEIANALLKALGSLHQNRVNHLALSMGALWIHQGQLSITHTGSAVLMKRGLSLSKSTDSIDPHLLKRIPYASPEELTGKLTHASCDLYAASALIHELLAGPICDQSIDVSVLLGQGGGLSSLVSPQLSEPWRLLITRGLGLTTRDRFSSANQMSQQLAECPSSPLNEDIAGPISELSPTRSSLLEDVESDFEFESTISEQDDLHSTDEPPRVSTLETDLDAITSALEEADSADELKTSESLTPTEAVQAEPSGVQGERATTESTQDQGLTSQEIAGKGSTPEGDSSESSSDDLSATLKSPEQHSQSEASPESATEVASEQKKTAGEDASANSDLGVELAVQSLRSKLSSPQPELVKSSSVGELAFGASDQDEMAFGFSQNDSDERTFLEFGDIDEKTVFEEDLDASVQSSHKTLMGLPATQLDDAILNSSAQQPARGADLQSPDFLEDFQAELEPSRVLPIPTAQRREALGVATAPQRGVVSGPSHSTTPTPETKRSPSALEDPASSSSRIQGGAQPDLQVRPLGEVDLPPIPTPSTPELQSSAIGVAHDWPGNDSGMYTPPQHEPSAVRERQAPRLKEKKSFGARLVSLIVILLFCGVGGVGIYWTASHWDQVSSLISSESAESINISTNISSTPPMSVQIGESSPKPIPTYFSYEGGYSVGDPLSLKFTWPQKTRRKRSRRRKVRPKWRLIKMQVQVLPGDSNLYFIGDNKSTDYTHTLITSAGEQLQVTLGDQLLGQTPLIIAGPRGHKLSLTVVGTNLSESKEVKLGDPAQAQINFADTAP